MRASIAGLATIVLLALAACTQRPRVADMDSADVPAPARPLLALHRAFLTGSDPHAAFQAIICEENRLYAKYGDEEGRRLATLVEVVFRASLSDAERMEFHARDQSLAGHTFEITQSDRNGPVTPDVCVAR